MANTERLYYTDSALREFEARVLQVESLPQGCRVTLDRTAFYPASGGQPSDRGMLGGITVLDVIDEGAAVVHVLDRALASETVLGVIDWPRRFDHMQQHTGQHVLSAAFEATARLKTVSFHLGEDVSTIDLDSDRAIVDWPRQIDEAEALANQIIFEDRPVNILFRQADEAQQMGLRKPTFREGEVRLVEVENFDLSACGGTHVTRTGAIGMILARKAERTKQLMRLEFLCGGRARRAAQDDFRILSEAGSLLSAAPGKIPELIRKQSEEARQALKSVEALTRRVARYRASELWTAAPERDGFRIVREVFQLEEKSEAKMIAQSAGTLPRCIFLIGVHSQPAALYFAQTAGGRADMGSLLKQTVSSFGGKGGGARDFAQGGGIDDAKLDEALNHAEALLNSKP